MTLLAANILIVDDEQAIADLVEVYLKNENYNIFKFYNSKDALNCIENEKLELKNTAKGLIIRDEYLIKSNQSLSI